jgi:Ca2+-binding RTX toxin-like protein
VSATQVRKDDDVQEIPPITSPRRVVGVAVGALALLAGPGAVSSAAADPGFTCRSSVVRAHVLTGDPIEPFVANALNPRCVNDTAGLGPGALPGGLELDLASASTATNGAAAPAARTAAARADVARISVPGLAGTLLVEGVTVSVSGSCAGGTAQAAGRSAVARITLAGNELPTGQIVDQALGGLGGTPLGAVLRIVPGEEIRTSSGIDATLTRRALHVTVALAEQTLVDAVIGEASVGTADSACAATSGTGGGTGGAGGGAPVDVAGSRPVAGLPFGGGRAVTLADLAALGVASNHPCRNARYGGNVAIVGTNRRDRISGSNVADRMFGFRQDDRLSGANGRDCVDGAGGRDRLSGSRGNDLLLGGAARDRVSGGPGRDRLRGGGGRDVVNGAAGNDRLFGGGGKDTLSAGRGRDRVFGGAGNDRINAATVGPRQFVDCGRGRDVVRLNRNDRQRRCERVLRVR